MRVLICYDGSADAQAAIERAGQLMPGGDATVLVIWETLVETLTRNGSLGLRFGMLGPYGDDGTDAALPTSHDSATEPRGAVQPTHDHNDRESHGLRLN